MLNKEQKIFVWSVIIVISIELIIIISCRNNNNFFPSIVAFTIMDFILIIIAFLNVRDHLSTNNVSWLKAKYFILPYQDNFEYNFNGEVISYDERYIICRKVPFFFCTSYVQCHSNDYIYIVENNYNATKFKTKLEARKKLKDILGNPNKYKTSKR